MKKEEIHLSDFNRILFGQAPGEFLIEVFIRTTIIYLALLFLLRILGKRMDGQITIIEMAVMVTLGAIVSVGMQLPDRGILQSIVALVCVFIFHRGINWLSVKNEKVEHATQGIVTTLVKDGIMQLDEMKATGITRQNIFATLRGRKIFTLGKVKRLYFESCGLFNVYEAQDSKPGLAVLPDDEPDVVDVQTVLDHDHIACRHCGHIDHPANAHALCVLCGAKDWTIPVK
jgi:uncharacterized membrane protein YcaP (DUF421 family)